MKNLHLMLLACAMTVLMTGGAALHAEVAKGQSKGENKKTIAAASASAPNKLREFRITAREGEITPAKIKVRKGDRVRITFVSKDSSYGVKIGKFGVKRTVKEGEPVTVEFIATEKGEFPMRCSKIWGFSHWKKNGLIVVR